MKRNIFSLLILALNYCASGQYFALAKDSSYFYSTALEKPLDENYRVFVFDLGLALRPQSGPFIKVYNKKQQLVKTINLPRGITPPDENPLYAKGNRILWPCTYWDTTTTNPPLYRLSILELDTFYNTVKIHPIGPAKDSSNYDAPRGIVNFGTRYVIVAYKNDYNSPSSHASKLYKTDHHFNILDSNEFQSLIAIQSGTVYNNKILATTNLLDSPCMLSGRVQKLTIDT